MKKSFDFLRLATAGFGITAMLIFSACGETATETHEDIAEADAEMGMENTTPATTAYDNNRLNSDFANTNYYEDWDGNDDNSLDENEFSDSFFSTWDMDDDDNLNEEEWNEGVRRYGRTSDQAWDRTKWNTNNDGNISRDEFRQGFRGTNYYSDWDRDRDSRINEREYTDGLFGLWDDDRDGSMDENRYRESYGRYFGGES